MPASDFNNDKSATDRANEAASKVADVARETGNRAASAVGDTKAAAKDALNDLGDKALDKTGDLKSAANDAASSLKDQARQQVGDAQNVISGFADEARAKVAGIIDDQKNRGADQLQGFSRAAESAAGELESDNPAVARLMRDAASTVDHLADDLRSTDLRDVVAPVSNYARQQPIAFFAASVFVGFVLARFVKSEPTTATNRATAGARSVRS